jgi:hypothetical protein
MVGATAAASSFEVGYLPGDTDGLIVQAMRAGEKILR